MPRKLRPIFAAYLEDLGILLLHLLTEAAVVLGWALLQVGAAHLALLLREGSVEAWLLTVFRIIFGLLTMVLVVGNVVADAKETLLRLSRRLRDRRVENADEREATIAAPAEARSWANAHSLRRMIDQIAARELELSKKEFAFYVTKQKLESDLQARERFISERETAQVAAVGDLNERALLIEARERKAAEQVSHATAAVRLADDKLAAVTAKENDLVVRLQTLQNDERVLAEKRAANDQMSGELKRRSDALAAHEHQLNQRALQVSKREESVEAREESLGELLNSVKREPLSEDEDAEVFAPDNLGADESDPPTQTPPQTALDARSIPEHDLPRPSSAPEQTRGSPSGAPTLGDTEKTEKVNKIQKDDTGRGRS